MTVFGTKDGVFQNLKVDSDLAFAFETGTDIMFQKKVRLFLDAKKALLRPDARFLRGHGRGRTVSTPALSPAASLSTPEPKP